MTEIGISRKEILKLINDWNGSRLDLFEISLPDKNGEFHGVMRFYFQDSGERVATKCIRVSSTATTSDVIDVLVEKFRPDMKLLTPCKYLLFEVHANGDDRFVRMDEKPLLVQLNWNKDMREGRFLLKRDDDKTVKIKENSENGNFKRKLSKREKKEKKKREKEEKENAVSKSAAEKLYKEVPDSTFHRSISNPEAVMRKRRQLKLEKKLQQITSTEGPGGGTLKIYGESLRPDVPYKTLLLSTQDTAASVVKETLEKYGLDKEDPENYCLVQVVMPPKELREYHGDSRDGIRVKEIILDDDDCPLKIMQETSKGAGSISFQIRRRPPDLLQKKRKNSWPYLFELYPDGTEPPHPKKHRLPARAERNAPGRAQRAAAAHQRGPAVAQPLAEGGDGARAGAHDARDEALARSGDRRAQDEALRDAGRGRAPKATARRPGVRPAHRREEGARGGR